MLICVDEEVPINILDFERKRLNNIVELNEFKFQKEEVLKASNRMDKVIIYWYRKKKKDL